MRGGTEVTFGTYPDWGMLAGALVAAAIGLWQLRAAIKASCR